jgi:hypothetical protein
LPQIDLFPSFLALFHHQLTSSTIYFSYLQVVHNKKRKKGNEWRWNKWMAMNVQDFSNINHFVIWKISCFFLFFCFFVFIFSSFHIRRNCRTFPFIHSQFGEEIFYIRFVFTKGTGKRIEFIKK